MPMVDERSSSDGKVLRLFRLPFRNVGGNSHVATSSSSSHAANNHGSSTSVTSVARSFLSRRRRLRLDPATKLFLPYEPGKQVRSAISIKNTSKSHVAFKFQTTEPKSCFMRPPGAILAPAEGLIATVFKFVEQPENNEKPVDQKCKVKFKIMSLKVDGTIDYAPELFDELNDQVAVEQILRVVYLDPERPSRALEKLKLQLANAEAELEARKKPTEDNGSKIIGEGLIIDEWKVRREKYLKRQEEDSI
ncbi:vesicle-associated protein 4-2-like [Impatiens glandulifera]|uniref:vesicle-associated protein 4-2-like n=1 Tax=Impatiens glandulifera TaxID=253017 RepID=UPI001FB0FEB6|nr:vesicle-associated protein 4-2-like [Impatiens glandulifera]